MLGEVFLVIPAEWEVQTILRRKILVIMTMSLA
jgi:hypothetical protein